MKRITDNSFGGYGRKPNCDTPSITPFSFPLPASGDTRLTRHVAASVERRAGVNTPPVRRSTLARASNIVAPNWRQKLMSGTNPGGKEWPVARRARLATLAVTAAEEHQDAALAFVRLVDGAATDGVIDLGERRLLRQARQRLEAAGTANVQASEQADVFELVCISWLTGDINTKARERADEAGLVLFPATEDVPPSAA